MLLKSLWRKISLVGIEHKSTSEEFAKKIAFTNRFAAILALAIVPIFIIDTINTAFVFEKEVGLNALRVPFVGFAMMLVIVANKFHFHQLAKALLLYLPPFLISFFPVILDRFWEEMLLYSSSVFVAFSALSHLVYSKEKERGMLYFSYVFFLSAVVSYEWLFSKYGNEESFMMFAVNRYYFEYKLAQVGTFFFINATVASSVSMNIRIQSRLNIQNEKVEHQNQALNRTNVELQQTKERLIAHISELQAQQEEISSQRDVIEQQLLQIARKNKDITESISYASHIQRAIVPKVSGLKESFSDFFLFYQPCDKLSGDFFWTAQVDGKTIVTVADCTGHGIPGAMLSMLGVSLLNEVVQHRKVTDAGKVLNVLRTEFIRALSHHNNRQTSDGMDISLVVFDSHNMTMQMAGAYNPILHVRNGHLQTFNADNMPIARHALSNVPFSKTEIDVLPDDTFYLFTDGYQDQFGGLDNKKFKKRHFRYLLRKVSKMPMDKQYNELYKNFFDYMGENDQTDDVLLLGIKV